MNKTGVGTKKDLPEKKRKKEKILWVFWWWFLLLGEKHFPLRKGVFFSLLKMHYFQGSNTHTKRRGRGEGVGGVGGGGGGGGHWLRVTVLMPLSLC